MYRYHHDLPMKPHTVITVLTSQDDSMLYGISRNQLQDPAGCCSFGWEESMLSNNFSLSNFFRNILQWTISLVKLRVRSYIQGTSWEENPLWQHKRWREHHLSATYLYSNNTKYNEQYQQLKRQHIISNKTIHQHNYPEFEHYEHYHGSSLPKSIHLHRSPTSAFHRFLHILHHPMASGSARSIPSSWSVPTWESAV